MFGAKSISVLVTCSCSSIADVVVDSVPSSSERLSSCATVTGVTVEADAVAGASRRIAGVTTLTSAGAGEAEDVVILNAEM